jgi:hypothetical protein
MNHSAEKDRSVRCRHIIRAFVGIVLAAIGPIGRVTADDLTYAASQLSKSPAPQPKEQPATKPGRPVPSKPLSKNAPSKAVDLGFKPFSAIQLDIQPTGKLLPNDLAISYFDSAGQADANAPREWAMTEYNWVAPGVCHRPLYFEEVNLERYGYSCGVVQPAVSTGHFFGRSLVLPVLMTLQHPWQCVYPLGYDRPGDCAPYYLYEPILRH